ncbi:HAD hydrolase, family IIIA domain protein [Burkholderia cepacia]|nr:HAD hydrolase, family IIIA domain protein [Burkholderia cepacia]
MALRHERRRPGAVLLDKDGTLLDDVPYNVDPARMRLAPGAARALRILGATGMPLAVVSNQPGVALGRFGENELGAVRQRLAELFEANGATLTDFFTVRITRRAA